MNLLYLAMAIEKRIIKCSSVMKNIETKTATRKDAPSVSKYVGISLDISFTFFMITHKETPTFVANHGTVTDKSGFNLQRKGIEIKIEAVSNCYW